MFFWLAGVGGDGRRRAVNDGGGDVQRNDARDFGERRDGRRLAAVDRRQRRRRPGGREYLFIWLVALWEEVAKTRI